MINGRLDYPHSGKTYHGVPVTEFTPSEINQILDELPGFILECDDNLFITHYMELSYPIVTDYRWVSKIEIIIYKNKRSEEYYANGFNDKYGYLIDSVASNIHVHRADSMMLKGVLAQIKTFISAVKLLTMDKSVDIDDITELIWGAR